MKKFKIRCSAIGNIITRNEITEKQLIELENLEKKEKLTNLQEIKLYDLKYKRDNWTLSEGAKTYCKDWLKGQLFDYEKIFRSKYTDKGNIMEYESIDFIAEQLGYGFLLKNEEHFSDEYMQGTPDIILKSEVIDVKNSWDANTYPFFDDSYNKDYYWQLQGYMNLTGKDKAKLIFCLMDTPEHLIHKEAYWYSMNLGYDELEKEIYDKFLHNLTYKNVPNKYKLRVFEIERKENDIQRIKENVEACRIYIDKLLKTLS